MRPDAGARLRPVGAVAVGPRRRRGRAAVLAVLLAAGACTSPPPATNGRLIPGTRVRLVVPDGFAMAQRFPGLVADDARSSVTVIEVPGPVQAILAEMTAEALAARGMELLRSEEVTVDGREGLLVHARQAAATGTDFRRWIVAFGAADASVVITASAPRSSEDRMGETLRRILIGAKWNPSETLDPYAGLGFALAEAGSLKVSDRLPSMVSFTRGGHHGALAPGEPLFLAGSFFSPVAVTDLEEFARRRLGEIAELRESEVLSERSFTLGGLPAHEIVVAVADRRTGAPLRVYQALAVAGDRFFLMQGLVGAENAEEFLPQFREIAHSFHHTP